MLLYTYDDRFLEKGKKDVKNSLNRRISRFIR